MITCEKLEKTFNAKVSELANSKQKQDFCLDTMLLINNLRANVQSQEDEVAFKALYSFIQNVRANAQTATYAKTWGLAI